MISSTIKGDKIIFSCTYNEREQVKQLGAKWNAVDRVWWMPVTAINENKVREANIPLSDRRETVSAKSVMYVADDRIKTEAYEHQKEMTRFFLQHKQCLFLCDPGVGKSKAAIDAIVMSEVKRTLVISPMTIMSNFQKEISTHSTLTSLVVYGDIDTRRELLACDVDVHIINYDMVHKLKTELIARQYDMVVVDEIHMAKVHTSVRSKAVHEVVQNIPYRIGMTGTLISNSYMDCFMPFKIIAPTVFGTYVTKFKERYIRYGGYGNHQIIGYYHEQELKTLMKSRSISYTLDDVVDLPPEVEQTVLVDLSATNQRAYKKLKDEMIYELDNQLIVPTNALTKLLRLSQMASGFTSDGDKVNDIGDDKLDVLIDMISQVSGKCIVFARFTHSIDRIMNRLHVEGISAYCYDGRTKEKSLYAKFNEDDTKVWVAQLQTSTGYSIPNAKQAFFYELDYSRVNLIQSKGRNRRVSGSEQGSCVYTYLLAKKTVDEAVYKSLQNKDVVASEAMEFIRRDEA